ncbi:protein ZINC INDUCED FACILITATOR-LIKE 1-like [Miscanthus floridulus]|uniref:protein ZINC INDUCED FACILITATOR-LIKE 1-like n=1 Tax=Miscanthus floridulus TaxID=154761 RepID=UPI003458F5E9
MGSHNGQVQELPPPLPPVNTGDEPLPVEETKRHYHVGCPGCQLDEANKASSSIPYRNFCFIWIICLTATLPIQSLFPYLYFMIRDLKVAKEEQDIGFYAGFVGATYFLGRTISAVPWGMFADKYGRKPCIVISILSVIVFNTLFGLSTTYWMATVTRGLLGLLCGILGPIKAYASEVSRKEHQALGISFVTSSRAIALVIGPSIGGFLSQPAQKYPKFFSKESIFGRFPYFLPCFVISVLAAGSCIACIWLPETLHFHDDDKVEAIEELESQVGGSKSTENLLKNWQLMSAIIIFSIFSLHDTAYLEIFSLWAVSSRKFQGLSFTSQDVGTVFAFSGLSVLVYQLTIYPFLSKFGPIKTFRPAAILSILLLTTYPFMSNLHGLELKILINMASVLKNVFAATITIACNILQNTAVTQKQRGTANGISVTMMSTFKAVAPAVAGIIFSWAQKHISGLFLPGNQILFLTLNMVSIMGLVLTFKPFLSLSNPMKH